MKKLVFLFLFFFLSGTVYALSSNVPPVPPQENKEEGKKGGSITVPFYYKDGGIVVPWLPVSGVVAVRPNPLFFETEEEVWRLAREFKEIEDMIKFKDLYVLYLKFASERLEKLENELEATKTEFDKAEEALFLHQQELAMKETEFRKLMEHIKNFRVEKEVDQTTLKRVEEEVFQLRQRVSNLTNEVKNTLSRKLEEAKKNVNYYKVLPDGEVVEENLKIAEEKLLKLQEELSAKRKELEELSSMLNKKEQEEFELKVSYNNNELLKLEKELQELKTHGEENLNPDALKSLKDKIEGIKKLIKYHQEAIASTKRWYVNQKETEYNKSIQSLTEKIKEVEGLLQEPKNRAFRLAAELQDLELISTLKFIEEVSKRSDLRAFPFIYSEGRFRILTNSFKVRFKESTFRDPLQTEEGAVARGIKNFFNSYDVNAETTMEERVWQVSVNSKNPFEVIRIQKSMFESTLLEGVRLGLIEWVEPVRISARVDPVGVPFGTEAVYTLRIEWDAVGKLPEDFDIRELEPVPLLIGKEGEKPASIPDWLIMVSDPVVGEGANWVKARWKLSILLTGEMIFQSIEVPYKNLDTGKEEKAVGNQVSLKVGSLVTPGFNMDELHPVSWALPEKKVVPKEEWSFLTNVAFYAAVFFSILLLVVYAATKVHEEKEEVKDEVLEYIKNFEEKIKKGIKEEKKLEAAISLAKLLEIKTGFEDELMKPEEKRKYPNEEWYNTFLAEIKKGRE